MRLLLLVLPLFVLLLCHLHRAHADQPRNSDGSCMNSDMESGGVSTKFNTRISFVGASGQLKVTNSSTCNFIKLKWDKLEEIDVRNNTVKKINNFASQNVVWSSVVSGTWGIYSFQRADLTGTLVFHPSVGSPFINISVIVFNTTAIVANGNSSQWLPVPGGTAKFAITIQNWPFASVNNSLRFGVSFTYGGGLNRVSVDSGDVNSDRDGWRRLAAQYGTSLTTTHIGPGRIDSPGLGFADGQNCTVWQQPYAADSDGTPAIQWVFPYFASTLFYDPVVSAFDSASITSASGASAEAGVVILYNLVLMLVLMVVFMKP